MYNNAQHNVTTGLDDLGDTTLTREEILVLKRVVTVARRPECIALILVDVMAKAMRLVQLGLVCRPVPMDRSGGPMSDCLVVEPTPRGKKVWRVLENLAKQRPRN
jgi:hypothetical protein